jgi:tetratricopeptide (TPR) repeat protein
MKTFLITYRAPLLTLALIFVVMGVDYRFRATDVDAYARGLEALKSGQSQLAVTEFGRALRQNPSDPAARLGLASAYEALGWLDEAAKEYEMTIKRAAETLKQSYISSARLSEKAGHKDEAKRYARSAGALEQL